MPSILARCRPILAATCAAASALALAACGSSGHSQGSSGHSQGSGAVAGPSAASAHSAADPVTQAPARGWAFLHGPSHYGASAATGPRSAHVAWSRKLGSPIVPGPVVNGTTAYVGTDDGSLHALNVRNGRPLWTFDGGGSYGSDLSTGPLILPSHLILWPGPRDRLFALTASGALRWSLTAQASITTPVWNPSTKLLVIADISGDISGYRLAAGNRAPHRVWTRKLATPSYGSPVMAADGTIYQTAGNSLYAVTPAGHLKWSVRTPAAVEVSAAIATNGIVVFGSNDRYERGVDPDGRLRWREPIGDFTYSSPLTLPGRRVLFGNHIGQMTLLNTDTGAVVRRYAARGQLWTAAAVDRRGSVYFASRLGHVYGFAADGRSLFDLATGSQYDSYPALAADGTLLVGDVSGSLYAIR